MNRITKWPQVLFFSGLVICCLGACLKKPSSPEPLRVLCGSSMHPPIQSLINSYLATHPGLSIELDLGGAETLAPRVLSGAPADLFIAHSPFPEELERKGLIVKMVQVGVLRPVLIVPPGNPKSLGSLKSLAAEGLRIGTGDPRYSTCGEFFVAALKEHNLFEQVSKNVVFEGRTHGEIARSVTVGGLDAAIVWNFAAKLHADRCESLPLPEVTASAAVYAIALKSSRQQETALALLDWFSSPAALQIFSDSGYR